jgi:hypothetical protein
MIGVALLSHSILNFKSLTVYFSSDLSILNVYLVTSPSVVCLLTETRASTIFLLNVVDDCGLPFTSVRVIA